MASIPTFDDGATWNPTRWSAAIIFLLSGLALPSGLAAQDKPGPGAPLAPVESKPAEKTPGNALVELNLAIRQGLPKGKGKDAERARAEHFREGRRQFSEFIKKYDDQFEAYPARVMRATLSLALGERNEAARDLEAVLGAFAKAEEGPQLAVRLEALGWYCEADPAKARPLVAEYAASKGADAAKAQRMGLRVEAAARLREGNELPPFSARSIDGTTISNTTYPGKVVFIHFWKSSLPESIEELRALKKLYRAKHADGFEIVGVSLDENRIRSVPGGGEASGDGPEGLRRFVAEFGVAWPQIYDGGGRDSMMAQVFNVGNLPWNVVVDRKGKIRGLGVPIEDLPEKVGMLLGER